MRRINLLVLALVAALIPSAAHSHPGLPVEFVERPLTLPKLTLAPWLSVDHNRLTPGHIEPDFTVLSVGAGLGLNDYFQVEATALPLVLHPRLRFGQAKLAATGRFAAGPVEIGLRAGVTARSPAYVVNGVLIHQPWELSFGIPIVIHAGSRVRINTGFEVGVALPDRADEVVSFLVPFGLYFQPARIFFFGFDTGVGVANLEADSGYIPLRFTLGWTVPHHRHPLVDLTAYFGFPTLVALPNGPVVHGEVWQVGAGARFFFEL